MSKGALAKHLAKIAKDITVYNAIEAKRPLGQKNTIRYEMDSNVSYLEISPKDIQNSAELIIKGSSNTKNTISRITLKQANYMSKAAVNFFTKKYGGKGRNFEQIDLVKAQAKAASNPETWQKSGVFLVKQHFNIGKREKIIYIRVAKPFFIKVDTYNGVLTNNKFGVLRTSSSEFAGLFEYFITNGMTANGNKTFQNSFTREQLLKGGGSEKEFSALFGKSRNKETGKIISNINVGHRTLKNDSVTKSVSQAEVSAILDSYSGISEAFRSIISKKDLLILVKELNSRNIKEHDKIFTNITAKVTKNVNDIRALNLVFDAGISLVWHSKTLNAINEQGKSLAELETELKNRLLGKDHILKVIKSISTGKNKLIDMKTSPSWLSSVINTLKHNVMSGLKKTSSKTMKVKVPKTRPSKNSVTTASASVSSTINMKREQTLASKAMDSSKAKGYTLHLNIVVPENVIEEEEETCMLPVRKLLAIQGRLNYELHDAIKANMKLPALVYRTGRFAKSVKVINIVQEPDCDLIAYYKYMEDPYSVFDPAISSHRGLSSPARNPQKIIGDSIRSIAQGVMREKYTIYPQWV